MSRRTKAVLGIIAGLLLIGGLLQTPLLTATRRMLWSTLVASAGHWQGISWLTYDAARTDQLSSLRVENLRLKGELRDYQRLRQQLRQPAVESLRAIPAVVSGEPLDVFRTHILVNQGALDGVVLGAPVVIDGSILIGFITELSEHSAVCQLLFNPATSLPAEVLETEHARGLLTGNLYTSLVLSTIPRDAALQEGQAVVTVAQDITPPALVIGTIAKIYNEENEAYQQARLQVPYDIDSLRAVTILVQP